MSKKVIFKYLSSAGKKHLNNACIWYITMLISCVVEHIPNTFLIFVLLMLMFS